MKLGRLAGVACAAAALAFGAATSASAQDKVSLRLNWYLGGLHVPFYYGKERGFFAAEGIDLTINEGRGSANTVQVVAAGIVGAATYYQRRLIHVRLALHMGGASLVADRG